jgi:hypothetical protein
LRHSSTTDAVRIRAVEHQLSDSWIRRLDGRRTRGGIVGLENTGRVREIVQFAALARTFVTRFWSFVPERRVFAPPRVLPHPMN